MLFWVGMSDIDSQPITLSDVLNLKKLENYMRYQVDFLLLVKLRKICYFGLWSQKTLGQSVFRIFYFWLVWLVNLNTGGPLLHCTFLFILTKFYKIFECHCSFIYYMKIFFQNIISYTLIRTRIWAWTDCPVETMLRWTWWIPGWISDKTLKKISGHQEFVSPLKQFEVTFTLINIKLR